MALCRLILNFNLSQQESRYLSQIVLKSLPVVEEDEENEIILHFLRHCLSDELIILQDISLFTMVRKMNILQKTVISLSKIRDGILDPKTHQLLDSTEKYIFDNKHFLEELSRHSNDIKSNPRIKSYIMQTRINCTGQ